VLIASAARIQHIATRARAKATLRPWLRMGDRSGPQGPDPMAAFRTVDPLSGAVLIAAREEGHHTSGWWKNPHYDRALHLSLSFRDPISGRFRAPDKGEAEAWVNAFFRPDERRLLWYEGPSSREGREAMVQHWRLFVDPSGQPIQPQGEVYSKRWTPKHWKSWSDVVAERERA
jgi:hypothetical protein